MWRSRIRHTGGNPPVRGVHCLDGRGCRAKLTVAVDGERVLLGPITLTALEAGRLRAALRDAVLQAGNDQGGPWTSR